MAKSISHAMGYLMRWRQYAKPLDLVAVEIAWLAMLPPALNNAWHVIYFSPFYGEKYITCHVLFNVLVAVC